MENNGTSIGDNGHIIEIPHFDYNIGDFNPKVFSFILLQVITDKVLANGNNLIQSTEKI